MATVELSFTPLPAHVRTARLVTTAVARRNRVAESLLDEVRLAVGEACSRAVEAHRMYCPTEPVRIELSDRGGRFEVVVTDTAPSGAAARAGERDHASTGGQGTAVAGDAAGGPVPGGGTPGAGTPGSGAPGAGTGEPAPGVAAAGGPAGGGAANGSLPADIGLAVIEGLADDVHISATSRGVTIRMSWPVPPAE